MGLYVLYYHKRYLTVELRLLHEIHHGFSSITEKQI